MIDKEKKEIWNEVAIDMEEIKRRAIKPYVYNIRADGRVERICTHGVGHTIYNPHKKEWGRYSFAHTCDGCCKNW